MTVHRAIQRLRARRAAWTATERSLVFDVDADDEAMRARVSSLVHRQARYRFQARSSHAATVVRRTNWAAWGSVIEVSWSAHDNRQRVSVRARRRVRTALGDYGQRDRDLHLLKTTLSTAEALHPEGPEHRLSRT